MDNEKDLPALPFTAKVGAYSSVVGGSVHLIGPDGSFMGQISYLCQDDSLCEKDLQTRMSEIIADALNRHPLPAARAEVSAAEADQVKARVFARRDDYSAGFNAALRSGRAGTSADLLLAAYDSLMRGETISPEQKELSARVTLAACYGAAAFTSGMDDDQGTHAMARSFLLALIDPLHEELDYLRGDPAAGKAVREGRALTEAGQ